MTETVALLLILLITVAAVMGAFLMLRVLMSGRGAEENGLVAGTDDDIALPELPPSTTRSEKFDRSFDRLVAETGLHISTSQALGTIALCAVIGLAVPFLFRDDLVLAAVGLGLGILLPIAYFSFERMRYRERVQNQLPDAVFLIARSLRAGQNLEQSMGTVARYGTQPLAREFKWVVDQTDLGLNVSTALQGMSRRVGLTDFNIFVTAVTLYRSIGGNLALLLERVATWIRDRNLFRGYFRAATALGRATGFVIALAPMLILIAYAIWQPDYINRLTNTPQGLRALSLAAFLEIIGIIWLYLLLRTDY